LGLIYEDISAIFDCIQRAIEYKVSVLGVFKLAVVDVIVV